MFRSQIDKKNILSLLKGRDANLDRELISKHLVNGGNIILDELFDIFGSKNIEEFVNKVEKHYNLTETLKDTYMKTHSLIDFEVFELIGPSRWTGGKGTGNLCHGRFI